MFYTFMTRVVRPILWLLFRPRVVGGENVPSYGPLIVASNHLSFIDSFIIPLAVPRPVTYIAKADYFEGGGLKKGFVRWFLTNLGHVPVRRGARRAAMGALEQAAEVLDNSGAFAIYPEGTRSPTAASTAAGRASAGSSWSPAPASCRSPWRAPRRSSPSALASRASSAPAPPSASARPWTSPTTRTSPRPRPAEPSPTRSSKPSRKCPARTTPPSTTTARRRRSGALRSASAPLRSPRRCAPPHGGQLHSGRCVGARCPTGVGSAAVVVWVRAVRRVVGSAAVVVWVRAAPRWGAASALGGGCGVSVGGGGGFGRNVAAWGTGCRRVVVMVAGLRSVVAGWRGAGSGGAQHGSGGGGGDRVHL